MENIIEKTTESLLNGSLTKAEADKILLDLHLVIDCNPPFWMCKNTIVIARKLWENDEGDGVRKMKALDWLESTAKEYGYPVSHYNAILLHEKYCR